MRKQQTLSFCAALLAAMLFGQFASAQELPGVQDPNMGPNIRDLNTKYDLTGAMDLTNLGYPRIAVGAGGELNFTDGSSLNLGQTNPESGVYVFNGGSGSMAAGSSLSATSLVVGSSDPGGSSSANGGYRRATYEGTGGTFTANGATINADITVVENGVLNMKNTTVNTNENLGNGYEGGFVANFGGTIVASDSTVNLKAGGWTNYYDAVANINSSVIKGNIGNGEGSTFSINNSEVNGVVNNSYGGNFTATDSVLDGSAYNFSGGNMSLTSSIVTGELHSWNGNNVLKVDDVTVEGGRATVTNQLHVGAGGMDMDGGYVQFYANERYNSSSDSLTTITLTLTESIFAALDPNADYIAFYLSDFITDSHFYWYGADGQLTSFGLVDMFHFEFDLSALTPETLALWGGLFDLENPDNYKAIAYDGGWYTGSYWDVVFAIERNETSNTATPEPATIAIFGLGAIGLGLYRRARGKHEKV